MYTNEQLTISERQFKDRWVNKILFSLGKEDCKETRSKIDELFNKNFSRSLIEVENTQSGETHEIAAEKFFMGAKKNFILNESGTITWKHKLRESVIGPIVANSIKIRQIKKRAKVKAEEMMDAIKSSILGNEEYTLKIIINGFYGLFLYVKSTFFNPSIGATITAAGRSIIGVSMLTVEQIGNGYRPYLVDAHLQIIEMGKLTAKELGSKYTVPVVDVEDVLKHMLGMYYEDYYAKSFLRDILAGLSKMELGYVYIKNNFNEFIKIPEVYNIIKNIYILNSTQEAELDDKDKGVMDSVIKLFKVNPEYRRKYMYYYNKNPKYNDLAKELKRMSGELLMGFYFYNGDWYNGKYYETHVDIAENIDRVKVPTMD